MSIINWNDHFSVRVQELDAHHRELVTHINALADAIGQWAHDPSLPQKLEKIAKYAAFHFEREEQLLAEHGFPGLASHRKQHEELLSLVDRFKTGEEPTVPPHAPSMIGNWLVNHIQREDKKYGLFLNRKSVV